MARLWRASNIWSDIVSITKPNQEQASRIVPTGMLHLPEAKQVAGSMGSRRTCRIGRAADDVCDPRRELDNAGRMASLRPEHQLQDLEMH